MPDLGPLVGALAEVLGPAVSSLLRTTAGMMFFGGVLSIASYSIASAGHDGAPSSFWRGLVAALLALVIAGVLGVMLATKRAIGRGVIAAVEKLGLGARTVGWLFDKMVGAADAVAGGGVVRAAERVPLAEAERRLSSATVSLIGAAPEGGGVSGWAKRKIQSNLIDRTARITLARFRQEGTSGVDLSMVRDELARVVDKAIAKQSDSALSRVTALLVLATGVAAVGAALVLRQMSF